MATRCLEAVAKMTRLTHVGFFTHNKLRKKCKTQDSSLASWQCQTAATVLMGPDPIGKEFQQDHLAPDDGGGRFDP